MDNEQHNKTYGFFYPDDVDQAIDTASKADTKSKTNLFMFLLVSANFFGFFILNGLLSNIGFKLIGVLLVHIFINILIGLPILRFGVFKEKDLQREYEAFFSDSFSRFWKVSKRASKTVEVRGYGDVELFEYPNGHHFAVLKLCYGSNDEEKKIETYKAFKNIYNCLCENRMEFKVVTMTENFQDSAEFNAYINKINKSEYKDLMLKIINNIMEDVEYTNVTSKVILIKTTQKHQVYSIETVLYDIISKINLRRTAFRSFEFLTHEQYVEFCREFYGLEAIDLSMVKTTKKDLSSIKDTLNKVKIQKTDENEDVKNALFTNIINIDK